MRRGGEGAVGLILTAIALSLTPAHGAADSSVGAAPCSVAAGRDASNNTLTCNFGLTPEQLKQLTEAAVKGATEPLTHQIVDISKTLGVTEDAAKTLLKIVGEDQNVPEDKLAEALSNVAADYQRLQAQLAALNLNNPTAKALVGQAKPEIDAGHFDRAHELLRQATQAQIAAAQQARQLKVQAQAAADAQMLGAASSTAAEGDVALTERRYKEAAQLFGQAADYVPTGHASEPNGYLLRQEHALFREGDERGDNLALENAAAVCQRALEQYPRSKAPLAWSGIQLRRGSALLRLGERESGTARLEEAVAAYRAALEEWTRDRVPLAWAMTQMNLGNALQSLGERESGTARLEEAVAAHRAALEEYTRDHVPLSQAYSDHGLANGLAALAIREKSAPRMEEALTCMRAAVEIYRQSGETYWLQKATVRVTEMEAELGNLQKRTPPLGRH